MNKNLIFECFERNQVLNPDVENKKLYGEVNTPFSVIKTQIDLIEKNVFKNNKLLWLDPCAGYGYYMMMVYNELMYYLEHYIQDTFERSKYIQENMIYMIELNPIQYSILKQLFPLCPHIYNTDFIQYNTDVRFDVIIGNPPYQCGGNIKVPTLKQMNKKDDGMTIWHYFVHHSFSLLKDNGVLSLLIPSIWFKPDKKNMYYRILSNNNINIITLTTQQTISYFKGQAQTPTCIVQCNYNKSNNENINEYDYSLEPKKIKIKNIDDNELNTYTIYSGQPLPIINIPIIHKIKSIIDNSETYSLELIMKKTSTISKNIKINDISYDDIIFKNIHTTKFNSNNPYLVIKYSDKPCPYYGLKKVVLSHKMYGIPYLDTKELYGISSRDNYVFSVKDNDSMEIIHNKIKQQIHTLKSQNNYINYNDVLHRCSNNNSIDIFLQLIQKVLSYSVIQIMYESFRYRMRFLEKYVFECIPLCFIYMTEKEICDLCCFDSDDNEVIDKYLNCYWNTKQNHFK